MLWCEWARQICWEHLTHHEEQEQADAVGDKALLELSMGGKLQLLNYFVIKPSSLPNCVFLGPFSRLVQTSRWGNAGQPVVQCLI